MFVHIIDLANNKLKSIAGLSALVNLKKVDLGANRIRVMEATELAGLTNLEELWIGKNKIEKIEGLENVRQYEMKVTILFVSHYSCFSLYLLCVVCGCLCS